MVPSDLHEAAETIQREAAAISDCAERINAAGAEVKSLEEGLLDFPRKAWRRGRPALLEARRGRNSLLAPSRRRIRRTEAAAAVRVGALDVSILVDAEGSFATVARGLSRAEQQRRVAASDQRGSHSRGRHDGARRHRARAGRRAHSCRMAERGCSRSSRARARVPTTWTSSCTRTCTSTTSAGTASSQRPLRRLRRRMVVLHVRGLARATAAPCATGSSRCATPARWSSSTASSKLRPACVLFRRPATRRGTRASSSSPKVEELVVLGDVVVHELQLADPDLVYVSDARSRAVGGDAEASPRGSSPTGVPPRSSATSTAPGRFSRKWRRIPLVEPRGGGRGCRRIESHAFLAATDRRRRGHGRHQLCWRA